MYVAINPDSKYVYRNIPIHINVTCICIHICLTRSLKNPYQGQTNVTFISACIYSLKTPISTHIYKLALKFTFKLVECPILCSFEVLILIVMFFYKHVCLCTPMHTKCYLYLHSHLFDSFSQKPLSRPNQYYSYNDLSKLWQSIFRLV